MYVYIYIYIHTYALESLRSHLSSCIIAEGPVTFMGSLWVCQSIVG